jgi:O-antigen/teichoic acid export membrane protein
MAWNVGMWRTIIARSWPIGVSIVFNLLYLKGDVLFLWYFGRGAAEIGQYGSAYKVVDVMTMVPVTFMGILLPQLRAAWTKSSHAGFQTLLQNGWDVLLMLALPGAAVTYFLGPQLMTLVSPDLLLAGQLLTVLGPAAAVATRASGSWCARTAAI